MEINSGFKGLKHT